MGTRQTPAARLRSEGFALVLAILALLLLTFLGLTLAVTSSTELQIATNYRWGQQARFNAEAGIEAGKRVLRDMDWQQILPLARGAWPNGSPPAAAGPRYAGATRDNENAACDTSAGTGYGVVLNNGADRYENVSAVPPWPTTVNTVSTVLNGAFTLWIRRPLVHNQDGTLQDYNDDNTTMILTAEGTAPYRPIAGAGSAGFVSSNRAVSVMEVRLSQTVLPPCGTRQQSGGNQAGSGFGACVPMGNTDPFGGAMGAPGTGDRGTLVDRSGN